MAPHRETIPDAVHWCKSQRLHEIGCGAGPNLRLIRERCPGVLVSGTDISGSHIRWCIDHQIWADVMALPHGVPESIDTTLVCYTLSYIEPEHVELTLRNIRSKYLIFMEPWGQGDILYDPKDNMVPRVYHPWEAFMDLTGWRLANEWPVKEEMDLKKLAIYENTTCAATSLTPKASVADHGKE